MTLNYINQPVFRFERNRSENKTIGYNEKYGPYLYRNIIDKTLISSWDKPTKDKNHLYKGEDIGYNTDALIYYKNV